MYPRALLGAWLFAVVYATPIQSSSASPASTHQSGGDEYVVLLQKNPLVRRDDQTSRVLAQLDLTPDHADVRTVYDNHMFHGFVANMKSHCLDLLHNMSDVTHVERNIAIKAHVVKTDDSSPTKNHLLPRDSTTRVDTTWGLQRISSNVSMTDNDSNQLAYSYSTQTGVNGAGVDIYVLDMGIYTENVVFGGRARLGWSFDGANAGDDGGHGTHCAGIAAGSYLGVADAANVIAIRVLPNDGGGSLSSVMDGIAAAAELHDRRSAEPNFVGSIMSMSLGAPDTDSPALNEVLRAAVAKGMHAAISAGNDGSDACSATPARNGGVNSDSIVTVGSVEIDGSISSFSNTGPCVDIYAPGGNVFSSWIGNPFAGKFISGTSMAAPHVSGMMAYMISQDPSLGRNPQALKAKLLSTALRGFVTNDPNLPLLNNGFT